MIFDKGTKAMQWRKDNLFNKWCRDNWMSEEKKNLNPNLSLMQKFIQNGLWSYECKI